MNLFLVFLIGCFIGSAFLNRYKSADRAHALLIGTMVLLVTALYYLKNGLI